jgi:hypothetical protein
MSLELVEHEVRSAPAPEDDRARLKRLARAVRSGGVAIETDPKRLQHVHSPVLSQADGNQWLLAGIAAMAGLWWAFGWVWAAAAAPLWAVLYRTLGRRIIRRRLMQRIDRRLDDPVAWNKLWNFGGVGLHEPSSGRRCSSPAEDWRNFARDLPAETEPLR